MISSCHCHDCEDILSDMRWAHDMNGYTVILEYGFGSGDLSLCDILMTKLIRQQCKFSNPTWSSVLHYLFYKRVSLDPPIGNSTQA